MQSGGEILEQAIAFFNKQQRHHGTSSTNSEYSPYVAKTLYILKKEFVQKCRELKKEKESKKKGPVSGLRRKHQSALVKAHTTTSTLKFKTKTFWYFQWAQSSEFIQINELNTNSFDSAKK